MELGFDRIAILLQRLQRKRNEFAHGKPEAIDDAIVNELVTSLMDEHEAWLAVFNKRIATPSLKSSEMRKKGGPKSTNIL